MKKIVFILFLSLFSTTITFAGKPKKVKIIYQNTYHCSDNDSKIEGRKKAIENAKIDALADKFGIIINAQDILNESENEDKVNSDFLSVSSSDVKGEWVSIPEVKCNDDYDQELGCFLYHITVEGYAREIVSAKADLNASILVHPDDSPERECLDMKSEQNFYLYFKSPVSGYLLAYIIDENGKASRVLPYGNDNQSNVHINGSQDYVFFDEDNCIKGYENCTNSMFLYTDRPLITNTMYIIFSENLIHKANDANPNIKLGEDSYAPNELDADDFMQYIGKMRNDDTSVQVIKKVISVKK